MLITVILGFLMWGILTWVKRRYIHGNLGKYDDLPKELRDPPPNSGKPKQTYAEAKKRFMERTKKDKSTPLDIFEEAKIRRDVMKEHGHYETAANEGAFAIYERKKLERETRLKMKKEMAKRLNEAAAKADVGGGGDTAHSAGDSMKDAAKPQ